MERRKFISIIVLTIIIAGLTLGSLATEDAVEDTVNHPEDNIESSEDKTEESNQDNTENNDSSNTENNDAENTENNDSNNTENNKPDNNEDNETDNNKNNDEDNNIKNEGDNNQEKDDENTDKPGSNNIPTQDDSHESDNNQNINQQEKNEEEKPKNDNEIVETKSDNANLGKLILDTEGLSPEFDKNITDYYLIVDLTVEKLNIEAYPEDESAIVMIDGNTDLQEGENTINITVKAEAGNTKTYVINVTKTDDVDKVNANLKSLSVKGFNFYPTFKNNIYNYNLTINEKISQLEITAETEIEEATFEILGNESLEEGDNLIKIIVTARDGQAKREYKLNVYMSSKNVQLQETNKTPAIVILVILGIAILGTAIAIIKKH